jgi:hypothetical protein
MKWNHHRGHFEFESSARTLPAPAGAFGLTLDGRLTLGFSTESGDDRPDASDVHAVPLTVSEREEIAKEMISRWLKWLLSDGFVGPCPKIAHTDAVHIPGISRPLCTCAQSDGGDLSPETARMLEEGIADAIRGAVSPIPVETTE